MKRIATLAAALCLLTGCAAHAREPEGLALVRVLGVNGGDRVVLTAVCGKEGEKEPVRGTAEGDDLNDAGEKLIWSSERELALTNVSYLIINEGAHLEEVLTAVLNHRELSPSVTVWYAEDPAALLAECEDPAGRMQVLADSGINAPTAAAVLAELLEHGKAAVPVLESEWGEFKARGRTRWRASG